MRPPLIARCRGSLGRIAVSSEIGRHDVPRRSGLVRERHRHPVVDEWIRTRSRLVGLRAVERQRDLLPLTKFTRHDGCWATPLRRRDDSQNRDADNNRKSAQPLHERSPTGFEGSTPSHRATAMRFKTAAVTKKGVVDWVMATSIGNARLVTN